MTLKMRRSYACSTLLEKPLKSGGLSMNNSLRVRGRLKHSTLKTVWARLTKESLLPILQSRAELSNQHFPTFISSLSYLFLFVDRTFPLINDSIPDKYKEQMQSYSFTLVVPLLYFLAFFIGLPTNLLALWVLLLQTKKLPSTILLINLTIYDLLLLLVLPFRIVYHFMGNNWTFGEPFCRVVIGLFYGNMYGSVVCLALIAMDRYVALVHPFGAKMLRMICSCRVDASQVEIDVS
ncbi:hypothetical protein cypCar_00035809 [Cyprinus carpio]|nr:hypothetical protein cypCar_00035809 [Cyprinus carpio]